jgi:hypothetical protein
MESFYQTPQIITPKSKRILGQRSGPEVNRRKLAITLKTRSMSVIDSMTMSAPRPE